MITRRRFVREGEEFKVGDRVSFSDSTGSVEGTVNRIKSDGTFLVVWDDYTDSEHDRTDLRVKKVSESKLREELDPRSLKVGDRIVSDNDYEGTVTKIDSESVTVKWDGEDEQEAPIDDSIWKMMTKISESKQRRFVREEDEPGLGEAPKEPMTIDAVKEQLGSAAAEFISQLEASREDLSSVVIEGIVLQAVTGIQDQLKDLEGYEDISKALDKFIKEEQKEIDAKNKEDKPKDKKKEKEEPEEPKEGTYEARSKVMESKGRGLFGNRGR